MTVKVHTPGQEVEDGFIKVEARFSDLNVIRLDLHKDSDDNPDKEDDACYVCFVDIGDPSNQDNQELMAATGMKTMNLWYKVHEGGMVLIDNVDTVGNLEQCLAKYERVTH